MSLKNELTTAQVISKLIEKHFELAESKSLIQADKLLTDIKFLEDSIDERLKK